MKFHKIYNHNQYGIINDIHIQNHIHNRIPIHIHVLIHKCIGAFTSSYFHCASTIASSLHYSYRRRDRSAPVIYNVTPAQISYREIIENRPPLRPDLSTPGPWRYSTHQTKPLNETNSPAYTMRPKCWPEKGGFATKRYVGKYSHILICLWFRLY